MHREFYPDFPTSLSTYLLLILQNRVINIWSRFDWVINSSFANTLKQIKYVRRSTSICQSETRKSNSTLVQIRLFDCLFLFPRFVPHLCHLTNNRVSHHKSTWFGRLSKILAGNSREWTGGVTIWFWRERKYWQYSWRRALLRYARVCNHMVVSVLLSTKTTIPCFMLLCSSNHSNRFL